MKSFSEFITESNRSELLARRMAKFKELFGGVSAFKIKDEDDLSYELDLPESFDFNSFECHYYAAGDVVDVRLTTNTLGYMSLSHNTKGVVQTFKGVSDFFDRVGKLAKKLQDVMKLEDRQYTVRIKASNTEGTGPVLVNIKFVNVMEQHDVLP